MHSMHKEKEKNPKRRKTNQTGWDICMHTPTYKYKKISQIVDTLSCCHFQILEKLSQTQKKTFIFCCRNDRFQKAETV